jgi:hypothetical protein
MKKYCRNAGTKPSLSDFRLVPKADFTALRRSGGGVLFVPKSQRKLTERSIKYEVEKRIIVPEEARSCTRKGKKSKESKRNEKKKKQRA